MPHKQIQSRGRSRLRQALIFTTATALGAWLAVRPLISSSLYEKPQPTASSWQASASQTPCPAHDSVAVMPRGFFERPLLEGSKRIGTLISMDTASGARVDFLARKMHDSDFMFKRLEAIYSQGSRKIAMVVAAAFTSDWKKINGYAVEKGSDVGSSWGVKSGTVVIRNGAPEILCDAGNGGISAFRSVIESGASMFQQWLVLYNGGARKSADIFTKPRFFVEYDIAGKTFFGVANFDSAMRISEGASIMRKMGIKNALYLDGGAVSQGYYYNYSGGRMTPCMIGYHDWDEMPSIYTNVLVFYSE